VSSIHQWAERVLNTVEQDGASVHRVRLLTPDDGQVWESWFAPFGPAPEFAVQVDTHVRSLENEWPTRQVRVVLVAESAQGEVLSQLPFRVTGKLRGASIDSMATAQNVVADNLVNTVEKLARLSNTQIDSARRQLELTLETVIQQTELLKVYRDKAAREPENRPSVLQEAATMLEPYAPRVLALLEAVVSGRPKA